MNPQMTQTLELSDNNFKGTIKIILSEVKENTSRISEKIRNLRREERNIKMNQKENLEWKCKVKKYSTISIITLNVNGINSLIKRKGLSD